MKASAVKEGTGNEASKTRNDNYPQDVRISNTLCSITVIEGHIYVLKGIYYYFGNQIYNILSWNAVKIVGFIIIFKVQIWR